VKGGYEYRAGGDWESGECNGYWIRRCDDGTEKRYGPCPRVTNDD
jgi:hypothetical protein